jgi:hypothetical protein
MEDWKAQAACRRPQAQALFWPAEQWTVARSTPKANGKRIPGPDPADIARKERACKVCAACPVLQACSDHTLTVAAQLGQEVLVNGGGVWAGRYGRGLRLWLREHRETTYTYNGGQR